MQALRFKQRWQRDVLPALRRRARRDRRTLAFVDEARSYLLPGLVKAYAPKSLTPVVIAGSTVAPRSPGSR
jgi:hypothetical protein